MKFAQLCLALMKADSTVEVVDLLQRAGYWDAPEAWRPLGDNPGNLSIVANQQSDPVAALAEKLTNAIDARLINECWAAGSDPEDFGGPAAPRAAVARFIDRKSPKAEKYGGNVWDWPKRKRSVHAEKITVAVTGGTERSPACVSVADAGEGQLPSMFPETLCSLASSNKNRIPFAQGRYNMGGSGALRFCGPMPPRHSPRWRGTSFGICPSSMRRPPRTTSTTERPSETAVASSELRMEYRFS